MMSEESDSSSSCESSDESPVEISEIPLPSCSNRARRIPPKKPPRLPLTLPVSLPFRWKTTSRRGPPNILQTVQQNPNVNVNLQDVKCKSININIVNNIGVPNLDVGKSNSSPDVSEHRSSSKKLRKSKRISGYSRNELKFNDKNAIEPPTPNDSGCKCLVLVKNVNDDTNDEPMESDSPIKHYKNRKKCAKVSKKVEKHTDTENSCTFLNNINNLNDNKIVSPMKDNKDVERSEKVMKMTNIVKKDLGVELQNKTNNKSDLKTKPDSSTREEKSVEPDESETIDHGSQTDPILLVSDEVHEVLKNFDKHHVIENIRQNIFLPNDNDVIVITDNDTDVPVHKKKKKIDDSLMKFVVECSDKNKELVAEMYSSAYSEAFKMFHDDGWSAVWKIMIKAARLSGLKELIEVPATISNTPVVQSNTPVVQSNTPVVQSNTPVVQSNIPVVQSNTPVVQSNNTEVQSNTRVVQSNTPVVQSNTTVVQSNIPVVLSNTPVAQSNTRVVQSNTPVVQSNTPVVQSNTPVMQSNIPVVLSSTPIAQSNTRVVQSNTPIVQSNMPVVQSKIAVVQSTQQIAQSENRLRHLMNTTQAHHSCVNLLPPPPPPPLPCDDPPLPPMENSSPLENQRHPPLPAPPLPPPPLPTFAVSTPAYNVLQHKMLPQQLQPTHKFVIPRISPKTSHRNIFDEQHRKHSMQPVLCDYGPTPYTRPTTPRNMAVHRQNRVERVHKARHKLAQDWSRHQMLTANPAHNMDLGEHVMYAAQAPLPHLPPAYPNPTSMSREQMVMYEQHQTLLKQ